MSNLKPIILAVCQVACVLGYANNTLGQTSPAGPVDSGVVSMSLLLAAIGFTGWIVWWFATDRNSTHKTIAELKAWQDGHDEFCEKRNRSLRKMHQKLNRSLGLPEDEGEDIF